MNQHLSRRVAKLADGIHLSQGRQPKRLPYPESELGGLAMTRSNQNIPYPVKENLGYKSLWTSFGRERVKVACFDRFVLFIRRKTGLVKSVLSKYLVGVGYRRLCPFVRLGRQGRCSDRSEAIWAHSWTCGGKIAWVKIDLCKLTTEALTRLPSKKWIEGRGENIKDHIYSTVAD